MGAVEIIIAWGIIMSAIVFGVLYFLGILRVHPTIEINGENTASNTITLVVHASLKVLEKLK